MGHTAAEKYTEENKKSDSLVSEILQKCLTQERRETTEIRHSENGRTG